jgi:radical SAM protein with 4Fe4S-binding SPASM domain
MYNFSNAAIVIENTTLCGAHCIMCPREKFQYKLEMMPMDIFKKITDEAANLGMKYFQFSGFGDPLMDNFLEDRFLYIKEKYPHIKITMVNTAHLLQGKKLELVCEFVDVIKISNYGFSKRTYELIHRGNLKYEKIYKNIDIFLHSRKKPYTIMTFLDLPENHDEMEAWKNYYEPLADRIDIWKPFNWGGTFMGQEGEAVMDNFFVKPIIKCDRVLNLRALSFCTDGSISMCCLDFNRKLTIGNIKMNSLAEIINNDNVKAIQKMHRNGSILQSNLICKNCDQIRDRTNALIYTSNRNMQVGKASLKIY